MKATPAPHPPGDPAAFQVLMMRVSMKITSMTPAKIVLASGPPKAAWRLPMPP